VVLFIALDRLVFADCCRCNRPSIRLDLASRWVKVSALINSLCLGLEGCFSPSYWSRSLRSSFLFQPILLLLKADNPGKTPFHAMEKVVPRCEEPRNDLLVSSWALFFGQSVRLFPQSFPDCPQVVGPPSRPPRTYSEAALQNGDFNQE
jgi:hypothetical protein